MYYVSKTAGGHKWDKKNLVTVSSRKGGYDELECACGVKGKSRNLATIEIPSTFSRDKVIHCPLQVKGQKGQIKITDFGGYGEHFANLTPGSIHDIIEAPEGKNNDRGVWVMGVGTPVKVVFGEFVKLNATEE